jgi:DNA-binding NarL/FixJ family response regulator
VTLAQTSRDAHASLPNLSELQRRVLDAIGDGASDEEIVLRSHLRANTVRPRRVELVKAGLVRDSGQRRAGSSGRSAIVWIRQASEVQGSLLP